MTARSTNIKSKANAVAAKLSRPADKAGKGAKLKSNLDPGATETIVSEATHAQTMSKKTTSSLQVQPSTTASKSSDKPRKMKAHIPSHEDHALDTRRTATTVTQRHGFKVNEPVVYPKLGVGMIIGIKEKYVFGTALEMFVIKSVSDKLIVMVPTARAEAFGLRKLSRPSVIARALETLSGRARIRRMMWARRAQEYELKIKSGDLVSIAEVARDLYRSEVQAEASYSERQIYETALDRMVPEIASVNGVSQLEVRELLERHLQKGPGRGASAAATNIDNDDLLKVDEVA